MKRKTTKKLNTGGLNVSSDVSQKKSPLRQIKDTSFGQQDIIDSGAILLKKPTKKSRNNLRSKEPTGDEQYSQYSSVEVVPDQQRQREYENTKRRMEYILNVEAKQTYKMQKMRRQIELAKKQALQTEESDDSTNQDAEKEILVRRESQEALDKLENMPLLNLNVKGIWSREAHIDFTKLQRKLSTFGIYGLDHDLRFPPQANKIQESNEQANRDDSKSPSEMSENAEGEAKSSIAMRLAATQQRRLDTMKIDLQNCIGQKFRVEKIDAGFKSKINENAATMFEKVIKEFASAQQEHDEKVAKLQQMEQAKREQKLKEIETGEKAPKKKDEEPKEGQEAKEEQKPGENKEEQDPSQEKKEHEPQPPDRKIDKTVVKEGKADIEQGKELNALERAYLQEHNLLKRELQLENLRHESIAGSILLKEVEKGNKEALETLAKMLMSTTTNKQKMRGIVFKEDYGNKGIADIEANFAENKYRKQAKIQMRKERRATLRRLYSDRHDAKFQQMVKDIESGEIKTDKFGKIIKNKVKSDKSEDPNKKTEPPTEYSSHSSDVHESDEESSDASSFDSEASRINFWRDINTKDDDYVNAVIVSNNKANIGDKQGDNFLKEMQNRQVQQSAQPQNQSPQMPAQMFQTMGSGNSFTPQPVAVAAAAAMPTQDSRPSKTPNMNKQFKQDLKKQQFEIKNYQKDIKALQVKIEKMKQAHDLEKKNVKQVALTYAIDYFKQKTAQLVKLFTNESMKLLQQYSHLRDQIFQRDEILKRAARYTIMQEEAIMELRSFIERNMNDIVQAMMSQNAGQVPFKAPYLHGKGGDGKPSFDRMLSDDPDHLFDLYTSIIHDNKASDQYAIIVELKSQIASLKDQINALNEELKLYNKAQEIWLSDKAGMENQLKKETALVAKLQEELAATLDAKNKRIKQLEDLVVYNKTTFEKDKARLNALHQHESKVHNLILEKYENEYENMRKSFRQVKNVLRIPRLNTEYQALMKEIKDDKQLEVYLKSDLIKKNKEIEPEGFDSISACLKMQFTKELDIQNLKYEILKNIDIKTYDLEFGSENSKYNKKNFQFNSHQWTEQATKRTRDSIYAGQTESNQQSKQQDLSYLIHSMNSRRIYNRSNDPNSQSVEREYMELRKKNITQNQSNKRAAQIPANTDIFIQNSEEFTNGRQHINNLIMGTSHGNTMRSNNEKLKLQYNMGEADQSILSAGSTDQQQDQDFSNFMNINDIQGGFSQNAVSPKNRVEDFNLLTSGASIESKQIDLKNNPKYESINFKRNVKTQGGARNHNQRDNKYFSQKLNLNLVPNINNFRQSMPSKEIESKDDLTKQKNKTSIQTYHDLFAIEDGITSPDLVQVNSKFDSFSPLSVRGFKQPVSPSPINAAMKGIRQRAQWQNKTKFIHIATPPDQRRDNTEDQVFKSTHEIIKSSNRIHLRNSQHNNLKKLAQKISPSPESRQFQGLRLQSMNEQKNVSTEKTSNIVSQNLSNGFKPISSQNMTIEVQSITSEQRKSINKKVFKKPQVDRLVQKQTGFMSQRQLQWDNVNQIDKK